MARLFKFTEPNQIWELYKSYLVDLKNQSLYRPELIKSGERAGEVIQVEITVPPTILGFCIFAEIDKQTYYNYISGNSENIDTKLIDIFTCVDDDIKNKQITGATVNMYNGNIVARLNGLNETVNVNADTNSNININIAGFDMSLND